MPVAGTRSRAAQKGNHLMPHRVNTQSIHGQYTVNTQSIHGQYALSSQCSFNLHSQAGILHIPHNTDSLQSMSGQYACSQQNQHSRLFNQYAVYTPAIVQPVRRSPQLHSQSRAQLYGCFPDGWTLIHANFRVKPQKGRILGSWSQNF